MPTPLSESRIRLGIVGCGAVAQEYHLPAIVQNPLMDVRLLCDQNLKKATVAKNLFRLHAATTTDFKELIGQVDAALVAVPPRLHAPVAVPLLEAGIDVLCEKPLATTTAEAKTIIDAAQRHRRILAVGLQMRFHPNNQLLREVIAEDWLGELQEVVAEFGAPLDWKMTSPTYYSRETTGGGVFFDMGIHIVDRIVWLFGNLENIQYEDDSYGGMESNAVLRGQLAIAGRTVPCRMAFSWTHTLCNSLRVVGTKATAEATFREGNKLLLHRQLNGRPVLLQLSRPRTSRDVLNPFQAQIRDFAEAVQTRREPFVTASSTLAALHLVEQAYSVRKRLPQPWVEAA